MTFPADITHPDETPGEQPGCSTKTALALPTATWETSADAAPPSCNRHATQPLPEAAEPEDARPVQPASAAPGGASEATGEALAPTSSPASLQDSAEPVEPEEEALPKAAPKATEAPSEASSQRAAMVVQRQVASVPNRAPDGTWNAFMRFCGLTLEARDDARGPILLQGLEALRPLARFALTMHSLEGGVIELDLGDLRLCVAPIYGQAEPAEDLSIPPVAALGAPTNPGDESPIQLSFFLTRPLPGGRFEPLLRAFEAAHGGSGGLRVRVVALDAAKMEAAYKNPGGLKENTDDSD